MLDTNAVSAIVKGRAGALSGALKDKAYCISVITEAELRFGLVRRVVNPDLRRIVENFLHSVDILPWTSASARRYGLLRSELEAMGKPLAHMDLLIATHALAEDCTLISADRAFAQVPGLRARDWSAEEGGAASDSAAQSAGGNLAQESMAPYPVRGAVAQARTIAPKSSRKPGPERKTKAK